MATASIGDYGGQERRKSRPHPVRFTLKDWGIAAGIFSVLMSTGIAVASYLLTPRMVHNEDIAKQAVVNKSNEAEHGAIAKALETQAVQQRANTETLNKINVSVEVLKAAQGVSDDLARRLMERVERRRSRREAGAEPLEE